MLKYILAWKMVKAIFNNAKATEWSNGKAMFFVDEETLRALFPREYAKAKFKAEMEYNKNV